MDNQMESVHAISTHDLLTSMDLILNTADLHYCCCWHWKLKALNVVTLADSMVAIGLVHSALLEIASFGYDYTEKHKQKSNNVYIGEKI